MKLREKDIIRDVSPPISLGGATKLIRGCPTGEMSAYYVKFYIRGTYLRDTSGIARSVDFKKCLYVGYIARGIMVY